MRWITALLATLMFAGPVAAQTPDYNRTPSCAVADLATCAGATAGRQAWVIDAITTNSCTSGGTAKTLCVFNGTAWTPAVTGSGATGAVTFNGIVTVIEDFVIQSSSTTTNFSENKPTTANANRLIAIPSMKLSVVAALGNGAVESERWMDDTPNGECAPIGGGTEGLDGNVAVVGSFSYKHTFDSSVAAGEGVDCTITGPAVTAFVSFGFWFRSNVVFDAGDMEIVLDDGGVAEATEDMPAYVVADEWIWIEVDVTTDCATGPTCADLDGIFVQTTAQAPTTFNDAVINLDAGAIWIAGCEEAIGSNVLVNGVLGVLVGADSDATANTISSLTEWTDYFINYQSGNDVICALTDQSANYAIILHADAN